MHEAFTEYAERMRRIRPLAAPSLEEVGKPEDYSRILKDNYLQIGRMSAENRRVYAEYIQPFLQTEEALPEEIMNELRYLNSLLVNDSRMADIDVHLSAMLTDRLFEEEFRAGGHGDISARILLLAKKIRRDYYMICEMSRGRYAVEMADRIREHSLEILEEIDGCLEHERFLTLPEECRSAVLLTSVFGMLIYTEFFELKPDAFYEGLLRRIRLAERVFQDPFYRETEPGYDWESYEFRIYYYAAFLSNCRLNRKTAVEIYRYCEKLIPFLETCGNPAIRKACSADRAENLLLNAGVKAGIVPVEAACERIYAAYETRDPRDYTDAGISANLDTPSKYLAIASEEGLEVNERNIDRYNRIIRSMLDYLYRVPKSDTTNERCVSLFLNVMNYYPEIPECMSMAELCMNAFAAIHPPTYVHVNIVARLTACMTRHLLDSRPELFTGYPGTGSTEAVSAKREEIIGFAYRAALYHDVGKLYILGIITMYGRAIVDQEFDGIKTHPVIGAELAEQFDSLRDYVDIIRGHHAWYDGSRGYPKGAENTRSPYKTVIDIVTAADCLDAATDTIGRSYSTGKTFDEFLAEAEAGAGSRYAPFVPELLKRPECRRDIEYLLADGRERMYRETYRLLRRMAR